MTTGMTGTSALFAQTLIKDVSRGSLLELFSPAYLALTTGGHLCEGECHNNWNNKESLAPRCKISKTDEDSSDRVSYIHR